MADTHEQAEALREELERAGDLQGPLDPVYARHLLLRAADALAAAVPADGEGIVRIVVPGVYEVAFSGGRVTDVRLKEPLPADGEARQTDVALLVAAYYGEVPSETADLAAAAARLRAAAPTAAVAPDRQRDVEIIRDAMTDGNLWTVAEGLAALDRLAAAPTATGEAQLRAAVKELLADDDMPNHWDDCVCSYCVRYRRVAALVSGDTGEEPT